MTHAITEGLRKFLSNAFPNLNVHSPINNGELSVPYVLLSSVAEDETIIGNHTWSISLDISVHTPAYEMGDSLSRAWASELFSLLAKDTTKISLNYSAANFLIYSLRHVSIEEPKTRNNEFVQRARFKIIAQF